MQERFVSAKSSANKMKSVDDVMSWASKIIQWTHKLLVKIRFCVVVLCFCVSSAVSQMKAWCLWPSWFWQLNSFWPLSTCTVWSLLLSPGHKSCQLLVIVTRSKLFVYLSGEKKITIWTLHHFQQSVSWEETENYSLQPNVSGLNCWPRKERKWMKFWESG